MNNHAQPPGEARDAPIYRRTDIAPEIFFQALGRARKAARDEIERLIIWLDSTIDVDEDSAVDDEGCDGDDFEPSLGSLDLVSNQIKAWAVPPFGAVYDVDLEEDQSDREPSLGSVEDHPNGYCDGSDVHRYGRTQERWAGGNRDDREGCEHDGSEPDVEDEPSLGWTIDGEVGSHTLDHDFEDTATEAVF